MKKLLNKFKNYHPPKFVMFLYFVIPIFLCAYYSTELDNDIWFLLNSGKYVLTKGIPFIEPFTIHQNLQFVMQQWLSAVIFYIIYHNLGHLGLCILLNIVNLGIIFLMYKICMLISNNKYRLSVIITICADIFLNKYMLRTRPQIFDYLILLLTIYLLELYINKKNNKYLYPIPLLSILLINLHASMWFMLFLFILPYLIDSFKIKLPFISGEGYKKTPLFITTIISLLVGLINPYGLKNITYIFSSFGDHYINNFISEMKCLNIDSFSIALVVLAILIFIYIFYKPGKFKLRYFLLFCGTTYLLFSNIKSFGLFIIACFYPLANYLEPAFKNDNKTFKEYNKDYQKRYYLLLLIIIYITFQSLVETVRPFTDNKAKPAMDYLLATTDKQSIKLYVNYNNGGYAEYRGIKSYIDPRAEVFLKANNKQADIFKEYYLLQNRYSDPKTFVSKYNFTHFLIANNNADVLQKYLNNNHYPVLYKDKYFLIYNAKRT